MKASCHNSRDDRQGGKGSPFLPGINLVNLISQRISLLMCLDISEKSDVPLDGPFSRIVERVSRDAHRSSMSRPNSCWDKEEMKTQANTESVKISGGEVALAPEPILKRNRCQC